jgi:hypothetical protein
MIDLFGVVLSRAPETQWENYRCGKNRACKTSTTGFIATGLKSFFFEIRFEFWH